MSRKEKFRVECPKDEDGGEIKLKDLINFVGTEACTRNNRNQILHAIQPQKLHDTGCRAFPFNYSRQKHHDVNATILSKFWQLHKG